MKKLVVLASGKGTNFAAIARAVKSGLIPNAEITMLIANQPTAGALEFAEKLKIPSKVVESSKFTIGKKFDRTGYEKILSKLLQSLNPDLICLAGYTLILGPQLIRRWAHRIINIHPSLLPAFPGLRAQRQALEYGVKWTGCTVHFVTEKLDGGPIVLQTPLEIQPGETESSLIDRLLPLEHQTYVEALRKLCTQS